MQPREPSTLCLPKSSSCWLAAPKHRGKSPNDVASCLTPTQPMFGTAQTALLDSFETPDCWISNAELIIHYITVTYRTFSFSASLTKFLQSDLPREALSHPFLLREIMAFAGFHLAYLHPEKRPTYLLVASKHQDFAIKGLREGLSNAMTHQNCHTLYATSLFLILSKFAAFTAAEPQHQHHSCLGPIKSLLDIFNMVHCMDSVFRSSENDMRRGPLEGLFGKDSRAQSTRILSLSDRLQQLKLPIESESRECETMMTLASAIDSLIAATVRVATHKTSGSPAELRAIFLWPMLVPREFIVLAEAGHPISLLILAHYCVLIHWAAERSWCFERWASSVSDAISDQIRDSPWAGWLDWPLRLINEEVKGA
ncbi:hypothetical protein LZL87_012975 [Fusarium oxysporum]|nr:hypothetical protein LZL87_012975 [Fusarium oxysporum]